MKDHYDFSRAIRNPYAPAMKHRVTVELDRKTLEYFQSLADETGESCQTFISLFLREFAGRKEYSSKE